MKIFGIFFLTTCACLAADAPALFRSGFEAAEIPNTANPLKGWIAGAGVRVTDDYAASGTRSVVVPAAAGTTLLAREFAPPEVPELFVDFFLRPAVSPRLEDSTFVELGVSGLGFRRTAQGIEALAFDGNGADSGKWVPVAVRENNGWIRVTLRHDYAQRTWDLYVNDELVSGGLGFFNAAERGLYFSVFGGTADDTWLDDLYIGPREPAGVIVTRNGLASNTAGPGTEAMHENMPSSKAELLRRQLNRSGSLPVATQAVPATLTRQREQKLKVKLEVWSVLE